MIGKPEIPVACDGCPIVDSYDMTPLASANWNRHNLEHQLKADGWKNDPEGSDFWFCPVCVSERAAVAAHHAVTGD
ncbi:MAG: hypothetical protein IMZ62_17260 [Chloroflexi bacterium]|nr:hypothetical protein [Chloroflexota bacterium]